MQKLINKVNGKVITTIIGNRPFPNVDEAVRWLGRFKNPDEMVNFDDADVIIDGEEYYSEDLELI